MNTRRHVVQKGEKGVKAYKSVKVICVIVVMAPWILVEGRSDRNEKKVRCKNDTNKSISIEISKRQRDSSAITFISGFRLFCPIIIHNTRSTSYSYLLYTLHYACQRKKVLPAIHSRMNFASCRPSTSCSSVCLVHSFNITVYMCRRKGKGGKHEGEKK